MNFYESCSIEVVFRNSIDASNSYDPLNAITGLYPELQPNRFQKSVLQMLCPVAKWRSLSKRVKILSLSPTPALVLGIFLSTRQRHWYIFTDFTAADILASGWRMFLNNKMLFRFFVSKIKMKSRIETTRVRLQIWWRATRSKNSQTWAVNEAIWTSLLRNAGTVVGNAISRKDTAIYRTKQTFLRIHSF